MQRRGIEKSKSDGKLEIKKNQRNFSEIKSEGTGKQHCDPRRS